MTEGRLNFKNVSLGNYTEELNSNDTSLRNIGFWIFLLKIYHKGLKTIQRSIICRCVHASLNMDGTGQLV
jgi:hypothetical protein